MHRAPRLVALAAATLLAGGLAACSDSADTDEAGSGDSITIEHALGETTIEKKPTRVATVAWANHEVPLALGVVPVGMSRATWGDDDGDGVLPWVEDRLTALKAKQPVLFDETDGIDFEAVADTRPDVILAAYSGLSKSDYETLSKIAPTIAFPKTAWGTTLDQMITMDSEAIGLGAEGKQLERRLDAEVADGVAEHPELKGKTAMFGYFDPSDLSKVGFYSTLDQRARFFTALGMTAPAAVREASAKSSEFYLTVSAEDADRFDDVDVIVLYGDAAFLKKLQADPLMGKIPAIRRGSVVLLPDSTPLAADA